MVATRTEAQNIERFADKYRLCCSPVRLDIEREALGADYGSTGYTTRAQADELGRLLGLGPGVRLADIGSGSGWPGLYLAERTGCQVFGTDLPLDGVRRAVARARADGLDGRATYAVATGRSQPFRRGSVDAVVHTDVLCCLGPKLAMLRACHSLLRPGGRTAFTTILVAPGLDAAQHRRAVRAGPWQVLARRPYLELVAQAGFTNIVEVDVSEDYGRIQAAWLDATEARADEIRQLTSDLEFREAQADRRRARAAIEEGLLRRSLITATRQLVPARR
jgi:cyclopropane fatty-acyl-phospholipid synthase-like methyltransferase